MAEDIFRNILETVSVLPKEYIVTANALGRVLAEPVYPRASLPEVDIAAVDGYAVRMSDIIHDPITLHMQGESSSAKPFAEELQQGAAVKTYAGGKVAEGADAVIALSHAAEEGEMVVLDSSPVMGENICPAGIDFSPGDKSFRQGMVMNSRLIGVASTMHLMWLPVVRKPRVAILAVGNELALPGEATTENPITASSLYTLPTNVTASGGEPVVMGVAHDSADEVKGKIEASLGCDLVITTGGTSAGAGNLMENVLNEMSDDVQKLSVELNRNDYMFFTRYKGMLICSLPGNPTSSSIYFSLFVRRIINRLVGIAEPEKEYAILGRSVDEHDTSVAYLHASLSVDESGMHKAIPVSAQDGFLLTSLAGSDCLLVMNQNTELKKGDLIEYIPFAHSLITT